MTENNLIHDFPIKMKLFPCSKCGNLYCLKLDATWNKDGQFVFRVECNSCHEFLGFVPIQQEIEEKDKAFYDKLRDDLNQNFLLLKNKPDEFKAHYSFNVGSILNAYREGDISFDRANELLDLKEEEMKNISSRNHAKVRDMQKEALIKRHLQKNSGDI